MAEPARYAANDYWDKRAHPTAEHSSTHLRVRSRFTLAQAIPRTQPRSAPSSGAHAAPGIPGTAPDAAGRYASFPVLAHIVRQYVPRTADVLHVGCGNRRVPEIGGPALQSRQQSDPCSAHRSGALTQLACSPWVADMVADGHTGRIANVDISPVVMEHMREKHASLPPNVQWEVGDATCLTAHGDASFDAVIDKGTLDALMCGGESTKNTAAMACEVMRVLRPDGVFLMVRSTPFSAGPVTDSLLCAAADHVWRSKLAAVRA